MSATVPAEIQRAWIALKPSFTPFDIELFYACIISYGQEETWSLFSVHTLWKVQQLHEHHLLSTLHRWPQPGCVWGARCLEGVPVTPGKGWPSQQVSLTVHQPWGADLSNRQGWARMWERVSAQTLLCYVTSQFCRGLAWYVCLASPHKLSGLK